MSAPVHPHFLDAHGRRWKDGELLYGAHRWANSDHLYGVSAECGLKAVMEKLGMVILPSGMPPKPYDRHVDRTWDQFLTFATGRGQA